MIGLSKKENFKTKFKLANQNDNIENDKIEILNGMFPIKNEFI